MTTDREREPFAGIQKYIDDLLHPKGTPVEPKPLQVASIEENAQLFADELQEQALKPALIDLLNDYQANPTVDGVGLVALGDRHLSVRVFTDLNDRNIQRQKDRKAIDERYDAFAESLYAVLPRPRAVSWGLNFYNTAGSNATELMPDILENVSREVDASVVSFVMFRQAPSQRI